MYINHIKHFSGCNKCSGAIMYNTPVASEEIFENPSKDDLLEAINHGEDTRCVNCGSYGDFSILIIFFNDFAYDFRTISSEGSIHLVAEKENGILTKCDFGTYRNISPYDMLNTIELFDIQVTQLKQKSIEENQPLKVKKEKGKIILSIQLLQDPPYLTDFRHRIWGFDYDETINIIKETKRGIISKLKESDLPTF